MTRHPEQLDRLLDESISGYYSAEPRIGLGDEISAALHHRCAVRRSPSWWFAPLVFATVVACFVAVVIIIPWPRQTAREPTGHLQSVHNSQLETREDYSPARSASGAQAQSTRTVGTRSGPRRISAAITERPPSLAQVPELSVFPSPSGITPGERQLIAQSRRASSPLVPSAMDDPVTIAAVEFTPIQIAPISIQPAP